jgi:class 3 adenylate cyclase
MEHVRRKLATVLVADIVGYSRLTAEDEDWTVQSLGDLRKVIDDIVTQHEGRIFNTGGDSILAEFASPVECVRCAIDCQVAARLRNLRQPAEKQLRYRIGINLGDVIVRGDDLLGDGVNIAARLEGIAEPGGICLSGSVWEQVNGKVPGHYTDLGEQFVKNIPRPVRVYSLRLEGEAPQPVAVPATSTRNRRPLVFALVGSVLAVAIAGTGFWAWRSAAPESSPMAAASSPDLPRAAAPAATSSAPSASTPRDMPAPVQNPPSPPRDITQTARPPPSEPPPRPPASPAPAGEASVALKAPPPEPAASTPAPTPAPEPPIAARVPPQASPAPASPPAIAPPIADQVAAVEQLDQAIKRVDCGWLRRAASPQGTAVVSGIVPDEGQRARLLQIAERVPAAGRPEISVQVVPPPLCRSLVSFDKMQGSGVVAQGGLEVRLAGGSSELREGDPIRVEVKGAQEALDVRIDYFSLDGWVRHMWPNPAEPVARLPAGGKRVFGEGGDIRAGGAPFGTELIVVIASRGPLELGNRRQEAELAAWYLVDLESALRRNREGVGTSPSVATLYVQTRAR